MPTAIDGREEEARQPVPSTHGERGGRSRVARAAREAFIIFLGVFGAFVAESFREAMSERRESFRMQESIAEEIRQQLSSGATLIADAENGEAAWNAALQAGERPVPWYSFPRAVSMPTAGWDATVASGGVSLMDRTLFYRLSEYYESFKSFVVPLGTVDGFAEREILPYLDDPTHFYVPTTGELRPQFHDYFSRRRESLAVAKAVLDAGAGLRRDIWRTIYGH